MARTSLLRAIERLAREQRSGRAARDRRRAAARPGLHERRAPAFGAESPGQGGGYEKIPQGNIHFAGEHCSQDFQGFMEGGANEGIRATEEILASL
jgi:hypothetical protein